MKKMKRKLFTKDEISILSENQYVSRVTKSNISYTTQFKKDFYNLLLSGTGPTQAIVQLGFDPKVLGARRIEAISYSVRKFAKRPEGFDRKKGKHVGRPKKLTFDSPEEEIKYLKDQLEYQKLEIEFLKKLEALEKKYQ